MTAPVPIVIDTDPGIDDALAILAAMADPGLTLLGLTTVFGNVPVETATRNALQLAALAGRETPVAKGAARPLLRAPAPHPDFVHGREGFGEAVLPPPERAPDPRNAASFLAETARDARDRGTPLTIVAVGPLTNLATALTEHPEMAQTVGRVVVMGGTLRHPGNVTPTAEANFWQDPHAAAQVLAASWPVTVVGLDVTECVRLYPEDLDALPQGRVHRFLREAVGYYARFHLESHGFLGCYLHDPAAVCATADPSLLETWRTQATVIVEGPEEGRLQASSSGQPVDVALAADAPGIRARLLTALKTYGDT